MPPTPPPLLLPTFTTGGVFDWQLAVYNPAVDHRGSAVRRPPGAALTGGLAGAALADLLPPGRRARADDVAGFFRFVHERQSGWDATGARSLQLGSRSRDTGTVSSGRFLDPDASVPFF